jgi:twitching motility protein PilI
MLTNDDKHWLKPSEALTRFTPTSDSAIVTAPSEDSRVRFGFRVGGLRLLIQQDSTSELIDQSVVHPIPTSPPWLLGLLNLRGNLVPVFDLHRLLRLNEDDRRNRTILMLDKDADAVAVLIEGFPEAVIGAHPLHRLPPIPKVLESHVHAAFAKDDTVWLEVDHRRFFKSLADQFSAA